MILFQRCPNLIYDFHIALWTPLGRDFNNELQLAAFFFSSCLISSGVSLLGNSSWSVNDLRPVVGTSIDIVRCPSQSEELLLLSKWRRICLPGCFAHLVARKTWHYGPDRECSPHSPTGKMDRVALETSSCLEDLLKITDLDLTEKLRLAVHLQFSLLTVRLLSCSIRCYAVGG